MSGAELNVRAVPSNLECPQVVMPRGIYKSGIYSAPLGLREGHRQTLGSKTCSHSPIHMHSVVPVTGVIPAPLCQLLQEPQWDRKQKSPKGQPDCLEREDRGQWPSPAAPHLPSQCGGLKHAEPFPQIRMYSAVDFVVSWISALYWGDSENMSSVA